MAVEAAHDSGEDAAPVASTSSADPSGAAEGSKSGSSKSAKKHKARAKQRAAKSADRVLEGATVFETVQAALEDAGETDAAASLTPELLADAASSLKLDDYRKGKVGLGRVGSKDMGNHKFWSTQPVPKLGTDLTKVEADAEGPIEDDRPAGSIRQTPYDLPKDFEWSTVDLDDDAQLKEVQELLDDHYVEDDDASFRFAYIAPFIRWALQPPGFHRDWHVGVRTAGSRKLVAFIAGIPMHVRVRSQSRHASEINFLCVHKKLRSKRLAPVLIREVTRRCHIRGIFQAIYTGGNFLPTPIARCQYFHRALDVKKLVELQFTRVPGGSTLGALMARNAVPAKTELGGLRELEERDLDRCATLVRRFLSRYDIAPVFDEAEFRHTVWSGRGTEGRWGSQPGRRDGQVVWSYVVEDPSTGEITDFVSWYTLPSTAVKHPTPAVVDAAYLFYYATSLGPTLSDAPVPWLEESTDERRRLQRRLTELMRDTLVIAKLAKFDVFNALTLADNALFLEDLKFGPGDGFLHYYLYNWRAKAIAGGTLGDPTRPIGLDNREIMPGALRTMSGRIGGSGVGVVML